MPTQCTDAKLQFQPLSGRRLEMTFDGGQITTDGGAPLLREIDQRLDLTARFAEGFTDYRDPDRIEHDLVHLLRQRVYALALGYEDLNDHDWLRSDQLLSAVIGKPDPTGESRSRERDRGCALAGKSTLNRLEQAPSTPTRHKKITVDSGRLESLFVETFLSAHKAEKASPPEQIVLDLDATDDPLHGKRESQIPKKGSSFTATIGITATCRSTCFVGTSAWRPCFVHRISTLRRGRPSASAA